MSVAETIRTAKASGVHLDVDGDDLILDADREPPVEVIDAIRRNKTGIVALLTAPETHWTAGDWRVFFDERAAIMEHDGGLSREEAEAGAFDHCTIEWMTRNPAISKPGRCAWCGQTDSSGGVIVPFGTSTHGHTRLHHGCWPDWRRDIRGKAAQVLNTMGLEKPLEWTA